ncbi:hypothetical protein EX30DRAFT_161917 [Ascodesmis nigricans]|uniref:Uncharacterized protein n=1 Tax=Ascodesmis nigricans TaxID=341454 RepID=A0A4S2MME3_9PEZI|nr:hypothetical protein EX30DRAFT_161917 [Ascodesmis nigricans]
MSHYPPTPAFGVFTWPASKPAPSSDTAADTNRAHPMNSADTASAHTSAPMLLKDVSVGKGVGHIAEESDSTEEGEVLENSNGQHGPSRTAPRTQDTGLSEGSDDPSLSFRYTSRRPSCSQSSSPPENRKRLNKRLRTDKKNRSRNGNSRERGARVPPLGPSSKNPPFGDRGLDHINNSRGGRPGDRGRGGPFANPPRGPRATLPSRQNSHPRVSNGQGFYGHSDETQTSSQPSVYSDALLAVKDLHNWNVTFHDIAAETGCSIAALRKMYKELKLTIPLQLPPPPLGYTNQQQPVQTLQTSTSTVTKNPDEEARKIREKLERSLAETRQKNEAEARERERKEREMREAEAAAREKERKEKEKVEEEKRKQLEVEAKRDILRKKLETMNLTGKSSPVQGAVTPVSSTPVQFATLHNPARSIAPPVARIPGLLMSQQETAPDPTSVVKVSQNGDIVMQNPPPTLVTSPTPTETPSITPPHPNNNNSIVPPATTIRRKRPVASDSFPDYALPKRRFGTQTSDPLIIEASEDEDDNTFKSPQLFRAKTLPLSSTPTVTTQAEELEKKIKALKAEIAAKKRKTKNGTSAGPTPAATPPVRDVPLQHDVLTAPATGSEPALTKVQALSANGTNESTTNSIQSEENGSEQAEQTRQELQAALSKAEDQQRTLLEEQTQRKQPEITDLSSSTINKEEENRLKRLREIEEKVEARKRAMEEMRREMEELEASRRALSEECRPFSPPAYLKQAEKGLFLLNARPCNSTTCFPSLGTAVSVFGVHIITNII